MSKKKGETFVVDGINVCYWWGQVHKQSSTHKDGISIRPLILLLTEIRNHGDDFLCIFDASIERALQTKGSPEEWAILSEFLDQHHNRFIRVTGGTQADPVILHVSERSGSRIISNDRYGDFTNQFPWLEEKHGTRFLRGNFLPDGSMTVSNLDYGFLSLDSRTTTHTMAAGLAPLLSVVPLAYIASERKSVVSSSRKQVKTPVDQLAKRRIRGEAQAVFHKMPTTDGVKTPNKKTTKSKKAGGSRKTSQPAVHSTTKRRAQTRQKRSSVAKTCEFQTPAKEMSLGKKIGLGIGGLAALALAVFGVSKAAETNIMPWE